MHHHDLQFQLVKSLQTQENCGTVTVKNQETPPVSGVKSHKARTQTRCSPLGITDRDMGGGGVFFSYKEKTKSGNVLFDSSKMMS